MGRLRIKTRVPKPKFKTQEEFDAYYMTHCWSCRKPLPEDMVRGLEQIKRETPEVRFMMHCPQCLAKNR
jgi:hypothetical protein